MIPHLTASRATAATTARVPPSLLATGLWLLLMTPVTAQADCDENQPCPDDGLACTEDLCAGAAGCTYPISEGYCLIDGICYASGQSEDNNPCQICDPDQDPSAWSSASVEVSCSDGNACTTEDYCSEGSCVSETPVTCNTPPVCHLPGVCQPSTGTCSYAPKEDNSPCGDGNFCTDDVCLAGSCEVTPVICDDNDPCTQNGCSPAQGCTFLVQDKLLCEGNTQISCLTGESTSCDDGNSCTKDSCLPGNGCVATWKSGSCNDGNPCTLSDQCVSGVCQGGSPLVCPPGTPCELPGFCQPSSGQCYYSKKPNGASCTDDDVCTLQTKCSQGNCIPLDTLNCDDENPCTDDSCDADVGCVNTANSAPCEDGNACTLNDQCDAKDCVPGSAVTCSDVGACQEPGVCQTDTGDCLYADQANGTVCEDGSQCTVSDHCEAGVCTAGSPLPCDDDNICTADSCDPAAGCIYEAVEGSVECYEGPPSTAGIGTCTSGTQICNEGVLGACIGAVYPSEEICNTLDEDCDGSTDEGDEGAALTITCYTGPPNTAQVGACVDGTRSCEAGSYGTCLGEVTPSSDANCNGVDDNCDGVEDEGYDDGLACTLSSCVDGQPINTPDHSLCNDEISCTIDTCHLLNGCASTLSPDAVETCNGIDDDCDGETDEDFSLSGLAVGAGCDAPGTCGEGVVECASASTTRCSTGPDGSASNVQAEVCDQQDNDCDGDTDEAEGGDPLSESCYTGAENTENVGLCVGGTRTCLAGSFGPCDGEILPSPDTNCDGVDDDCDGTADEEYEDGFLCTLSTCESGVASNVPDDEACEDANDCTIDACDPLSGCTHTQSPDAVEICNGLDDDCDSDIDEDFVLNAGDSESLPIGTTCTAAGTCGEGVVECLDEASVVCSSGPGGSNDTSSEELCDGVDNDCDDITDESVEGVALTESCYDGAEGTLGIGACQSGVRTCTEGAFGDCLDATLPAADSNCNGVDDNCDGSTDESYDDDIACTISTCTDGVASDLPDPTSCDDANPCTLDECDASAGCVHSPVAGSRATCDDADPCTDSDQCQAGTCAGTPIDCDDLDPCTTDSCTERGCTHDWNTSPCEDGNPCTQNDLCQEGVCTGEAMACPDTTQCQDGECVDLQCAPCTSDDNCATVGLCRSTDAGQACMLLCESDEDCNGEDRCEIGQDEVGVCVSAACSPSTVDAPPPSISDDATASDAGSATGAGSGGGGGGCALTAQRAPIPLVGYGLCLLLSLLLWMRRFRILPAPTRRHSKR